MMLLVWFHGRFINCQQFHYFTKKQLEKIYMTKKKKEKAEYIFSFAFAQPTEKCL